MAAMAHPVLSLVAEATLKNFSNQFVEGPATLELKGKFMESLFYCLPPLLLPPIKINTIPPASAAPPKMNGNGIVFSVFLVASSGPIWRNQNHPKKGRR